MHTLPARRCDMAAILDTVLQVFNKSAQSLSQVHAWVIAMLCTMSCNIYTYILLINVASVWIQNNRIDNITNTASPCVDSPHQCVRFLDLHLNKQLSKQWWGWWFETPWRPLWRQCNGHAGIGTGTISAGLMWYLLMSPGSAFTTVMAVPEFVVVMVRD